MFIISLLIFLQFCLPPCFRKLIALSSTYLSIDVSPNLLTIYVSLSLLAIYQHDLSNYVSLSYLSINMVCPFMYLSVSLPIHLSPIYQSLNLSVYFNTYLSFFLYLFFFCPSFNQSLSSIPCNAITIISLFCIKNELIKKKTSTYLYFCFNYRHK